jgi:hypothetical protein
MAVIELVDRDILAKGKIYGENKGEDKKVVA